jgi:hypothetical protein
MSRETASSGLARRVLRPVKCLNKLSRQADQEQQRQHHLRVSTANSSRGTLYNHHVGAKSGLAQNNRGAYEARRAPGSSPAARIGCNGLQIMTMERTPIRSASRLTRGVGSSSGSLHGSGAIDGWRRTSRPPSTLHAPFFTPHPSCCSCVGSLVLDDFRNWLF